MIKLLKSIYKPFINARYSMFLKSNKNGQQEFPLDDEYSMLSFFNVMTPLWSEVTIILLSADIVPISYDKRLILIGILFIFNWIISKLIVRKLKKEEYITNIINNFNSAYNSSSRYCNLIFCLSLLIIYTVLPFTPIVLFYIL